MHDNAIQLEGLMEVIKRLGEDARICLVAVGAADEEETPDKNVIHSAAECTRAPS